MSRAKNKTNNSKPLKSSKGNNKKKPSPKSFGQLIAALPKFSKDYFAEGRCDLPPQERDFFE
jgi:hypothetical protein